MNETISIFFILSLLLLADIDGAIDVSEGWHCYRGDTTAKTPQDVAPCIKVDRPRGGHGNITSATTNYLFEVDVDPGEQVHRRVDISWYHITENDETQTVVAISNCRNFQACDAPVNIIPDVKRYHFRVSVGFRGAVENVAEDMILEVVEVKDETTVKPTVNNEPTIQTTRQTPAVNVTVEEIRRNETSYKYTNEPVARKDHRKESGPNEEDLESELLILLLREMAEKEAEGESKKEATDVGATNHDRTDNAIIDDLTKKHGEDYLSDSELKEALRILVEEFLEEKDKNKHVDSTILPAEVNKGDFESGSLLSKTQQPPYDQGEFNTVVQKSVNDVSYGDNMESYSNQLLQNRQPPQNYEIPRQMYSQGEYVFPNTAYKDEQKPQVDVNDESQLIDELGDFLQEKYSHLQDADWPAEQMASPASRTGDDTSFNTDANDKSIPIVSIYDEQPRHPMDHSYVTVMGSKGSEELLQPQDVTGQFPVSSSLPETESTSEGTSLKALVDLLHMYVSSPENFEDSYHLGNKPKRKHGGRFHHVSEDTKGQMTDEAFTNVIEHKKDLISDGVEESYPDEAVEQESVVQHPLNEPFEYRNKQNIDEIYMNTGRRDHEEENVSPNEASEKPRGKIVKPIAGLINKIDTLNTNLDKPAEINEAGDTYTPVDQFPSTSTAQRLSSMAKTTEKVISKTEGKHRHIFPPEDKTRYQHPNVIYPQMHADLTKQPYDLGLDSQSNVLNNQGYQQERKYIVNENKVVEHQNDREDQIADTSTTRVPVNYGEVEKSKALKTDQDEDTILENTDRMTKTVSGPEERQYLESKNAQEQQPGKADHMVPQTITPPINEFPNKVPTDQGNELHEPHSLAGIKDQFLNLAGHVSSSIKDENFHDILNTLNHEKLHQVDEVELEKSSSQPGVPVSHENDLELKLIPEKETTSMQSHTQLSEGNKVPTQSPYITKLPMPKAGAESAKEIQETIPSKSSLQPQEEYPSDDEVAGRLSLSQLADVNKVEVEPRKLNIPPSDESLQGTTNKTSLKSEAVDISTTNKQYMEQPNVEKQATQGKDLETAMNGTEFEGKHVESLADVMAKINELSTNIGRLYNTVVHADNTTSQMARPIQSQIESKVKTATQIQGYEKPEEAISSLNATAAGAPGNIQKNLTYEVRPDTIGVVGKSSTEVPKYHGPERSEILGKTVNASNMQGLKQNIELIPILKETIGTESKVTMKPEATINTTLKPIKNVIQEHILITEMMSKELESDEIIPELDQVYTDIKKSAESSSSPTNISSSLIKTQVAETKINISSQYDGSATENKQTLQPRALYSATKETMIKSPTPVLATHPIRRESVTQPGISNLKYTKESIAKVNKYLNQQTTKSIMEGHSNAPVTKIKSKPSVIPTEAVSKSILKPINLQPTVGSETEKSTTRPEISVHPQLESPITISRLSEQREVSIAVSYKPPVAHVPSDIVQPIQERGGQGIRQTIPTIKPAVDQKIVKSTTARNQQMYQDYVTTGQDVKKAEDTGVTESKEFPETVTQKSTIVDEQYENILIEPIEMPLEQLAKNQGKMPADENTIVVREEHHKGPSVEIEAYQFFPTKSTLIETSGRPLISEMTIPTGSAKVEKQHPRVISSMMDLTKMEQGKMTTQSQDMSIVNSQGERLKILEEKLDSIAILQQLKDELTDNIANKVAENVKTSLLSSNSVMRNILNATGYTPKEETKTTAPEEVSTVGVAPTVYQRHATEFTTSTTKLSITESMITSEKFPEDLGEAEEPSEVLTSMVNFGEISVPGVPPKQGPPVQVVGVPTKPIESAVDEIPFESLQPIQQVPFKQPEQPLETETLDKLPFEYVEPLKAENVVNVAPEEQLLPVQSIKPETLVKTSNEPREEFGGKTIVKEVSLNQPVQPVLTLPVAKESMRQTQLLQPIRVETTAKKAALEPIEIIQPKRVESEAEEAPIVPVQQISNKPAPPFIAETTVQEVEREPLQPIPPLKLETVAKVPYESVASQGPKATTSEMAFSRKIQQPLREEFATAKPAESAAKALPFEPVPEELIESEYTALTNAVENEVKKTQGPENGGWIDSFHGIGVKHPASLAPENTSAIDRKVSLSEEGHLEPPVPIITVEHPSHAPENITAIDRKVSLGEEGHLEPLTPTIAVKHPSHAPENISAIDRKVSLSEGESLERLIPTIAVKHPSHAPENTSAIDRKAALSEGGLESHIPSISHHKPNIAFDQTFPVPWEEEEEMKDSKQYQDHLTQRLHKTRPRIAQIHRPTESIPRASDRVDRRFKISETPGNVVIDSGQKSAKVSPIQVDVGPGKGMINNLANGEVPSSTGYKSLVRVRPVSSEREQKFEENRNEKEESTIKKGTADHSFLYKVMNKLMRNQDNNNDNNNEITTNDNSLHLIVNNNGVTNNFAKENAGKASDNETSKIHEDDSGKAKTGKTGVMESHIPVGKYQQAQEEDGMDSSDSTESDTIDANHDEKSDQHESDVVEVKGRNESDSTVTNDDVIGHHVENHFHNEIGIRKETNNYNSIDHVGEINYYKVENGMSSITNGKSDSKTGTGDSANGQVKEEPTEEPGEEKSQPSFVGTKKNHSTMVRYNKDKGEILNVNKTDSDVGISNTAVHVSEKQPKAGLETDGHDNLQQMKEHKENIDSYNEQSHDDHSDHSVTIVINELDDSLDMHAKYQQGSKNTAYEDSGQRNRVNNITNQKSTSIDMPAGEQNPHANNDIPKKTMEDNTRETELDKQPSEAVSSRGTGGKSDPKQGVSIVSKDEKKTGDKEHREENPIIINNIVSLNHEDTETDEGETVLEKPLSDDLQHFLSLMALKEFKSSNSLGARNYFPEDDNDHGYGKKTTFSKSAQTSSGQGKPTSVPNNVTGMAGVHFEEIESFLNFLDWLKDEIKSPLKGDILPTKPAQVEEEKLISDERYAWSDWSKWTDCSVSCARGVQLRVRFCIDFEHQEKVGDINCRGSPLETTTCIMPLCHISESAWAVWSEWSICSATCGHGLSLRTRRCHSNGDDCLGSWIDQKTCSVNTCQAEAKILQPSPPPSVWGPWSDWSDCTVTCGLSQISRTRKCYHHGNKSVIDNIECHGDSVEIATCNLPICQEPFMLSFWTMWGSWSTCSVTCDLGQSSRRRRCVIRSTRSCPGRGRQIKRCRQTRCEVEVEIPDNLPPLYLWADWSPWKPCTATCGLSSKTRYRQCKEWLTHSQVGDNNCHGNAVETATCHLEATCEAVESPPWRKEEANILTTNLRSSWTLWSHWTTCSAACDRGHMTRHRDCIVHDGIPCVGEEKETKSCLLIPCPGKPSVSPYRWLPWSPWSECSVTCGTGIRSRSRECLDSQTSSYTNPKVCGDIAEHAERCAMAPCPVSSWSSWSPWSPCSVSCGKGVIQRQRQCDEHSGLDCDGVAKQQRQCELTDCQDFEVSEWGEWQPWSGCSESCGVGIQTRQRQCDVRHNQMCQGQGSQYMTCLFQECQEMKIGGQRMADVTSLLGWTSWIAWSECSVTCGEGYTLRSRTCQTSMEQTFHCPGEHSERKECVQTACDKEHKFSRLKKAEGHNTRLECHYDTSKPVKEVYWMSPTGEKLTEKNTKHSVRYNVSGQYLYIRNVQSENNGMYHCVVITDIDEVVTGDVALDVIDCDSHPCQNGGSCFELSEGSVRSFMCQCMMGFSGETCERGSTAYEYRYLIGGVVAAVFITMFFIIVIACMLCRARHHRQKTRLSENKAKTKADVNQPQVSIIYDVSKGPIFEAREVTKAGSHDDGEGESLAADTHGNQTKRLEGIVEINQDEYQDFQKQNAFSMFKWKKDQKERKEVCEIETTTIEKDDVIEERNNKQSDIKRKDTSDLDTKPTMDDVPSGNKPIYATVKKKRTKKNKGMKSSKVTAKDEAINNTPIGVSMPVTPATEYQHFEPQTIVHHPYVKFLHEMLELERYHSNKKAVESKTSVSSVELSPKSSSDSLSSETTSTITGGETSTNSSCDEDKWNDYSSSSKSKTSNVNEHAGISNTSLVKDAGKAISNNSVVVPFRASPSVELQMSNDDKRGHSGRTVTRKLSQSFERKRGSSKESSDSQTDFSSLDFMSSKPTDYIQSDPQFHSNINEYYGFYNDCDDARMDDEKAFYSEPSSHHEMQNSQ